MPGKKAEDRLQENDDIYRLRENLEGATIAFSFNQQIRGGPLIGKK